MDENSEGSSLSDGALAEGSIIQSQSQVEINHELDEDSSGDHTAMHPDKPSQGQPVISPSNNVATSEVDHKEMSTNILRPVDDVKGAVDGPSCAAMDENQVS